MPEREWDIRHAVPGDTERIYALKSSAFGASYLPFTIFRSPRSAAYLRELIAGAGPHAVFVLLDGSEICGYYDGHPTGESNWFLAYIAVGEPWRGRGCGDVLLRHFEAEGRRRGRVEGELDVFASNVAALGWYVRHGYAVTGRRAHLRTPMSMEEKRGTYALHVQAEPLSLALEDERRRGFSKVEAACGGARLEVGLIGGDTVKLLDRGGLDLKAAAQSLAARFGGEREFLILSGSEEELHPFPSGRLEVALRLVKRLAA